MDENTTMNQLNVSPPPTHTHIHTDEQGSGPRINFFYIKMIFQSFSLRKKQGGQAKQNSLVYYKKVAGVINCNNSEK
jgi:hypothetical protein